MLRLVGRKKTVQIINNIPKTTTNKKLCFTCRPKNGSRSSDFVVFMAFKSLKNNRKSIKNM
jgi:hypothetical protein